MFSGVACHQRFVPCDWKQRGRRGKENEFKQETVTPLWSRMQAEKEKKFWSFSLQPYLKIKTSLNSLKPYFIKRKEAMPSQRVNWMVSGTFLQLCLNDRNIIIYRLPCSPQKTITDHFTSFFHTVCHLFSNLLLPTCYLQISRLSFYNLLNKLDILIQISQPFWNRNCI